MYDAYFLCLVFLLGHNDFRIRERAHHQLSQVREVAIASILHGEQSACPERKERCRLLALPWTRKYANELVELDKPKDWQYWPWLDSQTLNEFGFEGAWDTVEWYLNQARVNVVDKDNYESWSEATRLLCRDRVACRLSVRALVAALCIRHQDWCKQHGRRIPP